MRLGNILRRHEYADGKLQFVYVLKSREFEDCGTCVLFTRCFLGILYCILLLTPELTCECINEYMNKKRTQ